MMVPRPPAVPQLPGTTPGEEGGFHAPTSGVTVEHEEHHISQSSLALILQTTQTEAFCLLMPLEG